MYLFAQKLALLYTQLQVFCVDSQWQCIVNLELLKVEA